MKIRPDNNIIIDLFLKPRFKLLRNILLLTMLLLITLNFVWYLPHEYTLTSQKLAAWMMYMLLFSGIIYLNILWAVPRFLMKKRFLSYLIFIIVSILLIIASIVLIQDFYFNIREAMGQRTFNITLLNMASSLLAIGLMITGSSSFLIFKNWMAYNQRISELETASLESELKLLKNQINPHFLFNMLNNAIVLVKKDKEEASRVLFKLEDLLRYQLSENTSDEVSLQSDIRFLNDYLNLEKIRRDHFQYRISKEGNIGNVHIPALLFITFVENAVKHNFDSEKESYVNISFKITGNRLEFICENSKPDYRVVKNKVGGIGLKNIRRRLELLYPDRHTLNIKDEETKYTVQLFITL